MDPMEILNEEGGGARNRLAQDAWQAAAAAAAADEIPFHIIAPGALHFSVFADFQSSLRRLIHIPADIVFYIGKYWLSPMDRAMLALAYPPWVPYLEALLPRGSLLTESAYRYGSKQQIQWLNDRLEFIQHPLRQWSGFFARSGECAANMGELEQIFRIFGEHRFSQLAEQNFQGSKPHIERIRSLLIDHLSTDMIPWFERWQTVRQLGLGQIKFKHQDIVRACDRTDPLILKCFLSHAIGWAAGVNPYAMATTDVRMDVLMTHLVDRNQWDHLTSVGQVFMANCKKLKLVRERTLFYRLLFEFNNAKCMEVAHQCGAFLNVNHASKFFWKFIQADHRNNVAWVLANHILAIGYREIEEARRDGLLITDAMEALLRKHLL